MQRAYLIASAALMELKLDGSTKFAAVPMLKPGGERHD
jgi:hypothetical protein